MFSSSYSISNIRELISSSQTRLAILILNQSTLIWRVVGRFCRKEGAYLSVLFTLVLGLIRVHLRRRRAIRRAMCKYGHVIGQQYTRGTRIIIAVSTTTPFTPRGLFRRYSMAVRRVNYC